MSVAKAPTIIPAMSTAAITIENLSKRYSIDHQRTDGDGMRHALESIMRAPIAWLRSVGRRSYDTWISGR